MSTAGQRAKRLREREALTKQQRLVIAGAVAPRLRSLKSSRRRIHVTDSTGAVIRMITDKELTVGLLETAAIELQIDEPGKEDASPVTECTVCGRMTERRKKGRGRLPAKCVECKNGKCKDCGFIFTSESTVREARKQGREPRCRRCRFVFLQKSAKPKKLTRKQMQARISELEAKVSNAGR